MKYEWNKKIANNLKNKINKQNYKCIQSERYSSEFNAVKELEKLISSKILVINYDENEPNFGSSILQGIAYYYNKIIIAYETHQVDYYVDGGQHIFVLSDKPLNVMSSSMCFSISSLHIKKTPFNKYL